MPTYVSREFAGVSQIDQPVLPSESKHALDCRKDETKLHRIEARELRLLGRSNQLAEYKKGLCKNLWNPRDVILKEIQEWKFVKNISNKKYGPYRNLA